MPRFRNHFKNPSPNPSPKRRGEQDQVFPFGSPSPLRGGVGGGVFVTGSKAIASGNPAALTLAEADAELQRLTVLKKNRAGEQYLARRNLRELPETIARLSRRLSSLTADMATATAHAEGPVTIGNRTCSRADATEILGAALDSL